MMVVRSALPLLVLVVPASALALVERRATPHSMVRAGAVPTVTLVDTALDAAKPEMQQVELYIARHAISCANVMQEYGQSGLFEQMSDPMITDCGVDLSKSAGVALREKDIRPDLVLSSYLLRAQETAHNMFPGSEITPVPFIGELGDGSANVPTSAKDQQKRITMRYGLKSIDRDLQYMDDKMWGTNEKRKGGHWLQFTAFLEHNLLPRLPEYLKKKDTLKVVLVTHNEYMKAIPPLQRHCSEVIKQISNNQVLGLTYKYNTTSLSAHLVPQLSCDVVHEGRNIRDFAWEGDTCQGDYGSLCQSEASRVLPHGKENLPAFMRPPSHVHRNSRRQSTKLPCCKGAM